MRIAQKKQAEEFVELLGQAHEEIRGAIEKKNTAAAMSLLADCQDGAIALGELIENAEGEQAATIPILEKYCELVYGIHESLAAEMDGGSSVRADKVYKTLRQGHIRIVNSLAHDVKVRREVVFLPYKASMWDSLESVWKAADEDPDCDAYVVPIPYYDKNPDGSFRELHYEGGEYPEYVPVVWYEDYDFEKRRPDSIFIHNPYDDRNIVTSVHPFFYSENLKKFTDKLVYIPYFILGEIDPENRQELESIQKFCLVPGVLHADQVIVQSEDMRRAYVNVLTEFMSGQGRDRVYWEKKILGLGSPKVDKVLSTRREDLEIPEEWMRVIRKPDGSWKKIIFYNTTVTALLQYNEQYLAKMRDVFRVFYEMRDEVALLWRPHPLFGATIESMRPELGEEYREIVKGYRRDGWGIYDDSSDMDRAVVLSDGYYGDWSSVLWLYQKIGKSLMVQNCWITGTTGIKLVDAVKMDNIVWLCPMYFSCLFAFDIYKGRVIENYRIPSSRGYSAIRSFGSIVNVGRKIYFVPFYEREVIQFEIDTKRFDKIELDERIIKDKKELFMGTGVYNQYIFMMGVSVPLIVRLDTTDNSIIYLKDWLHKVNGYIFNQKDAYFRKQSLLVDNKLFVPFCNANAVIAIDCENLDTSVYHLGDEKQGYSGICLLGEAIWLSPRSAGKIVKWNYKSGEIFDFDGSKGRAEDISYTGIVNEQEKKLVLSGMRNGQVFEIKEENVYVMDGEYDFMQEDERVLMYYESISGALTIYDKVQNEKKVIEVKIEKNNIDILELYKGSVFPFSEIAGADVSRLPEIMKCKTKEEYLINERYDGERIYRDGIGVR